MFAKGKVGEEPGALEGSPGGRGSPGEQRSCSRRGVVGRGSATRVGRQLIRWGRGCVDQGSRLEWGTGIQGCCSLREACKKVLEPLSWGV